jgi:putative ABC transport system permease protein
MGLIEIIRTALESLMANKLRAVLTMLGVIIGVMSVVLLLALGAGVQTYVTNQISGIGSNLLTISPDSSVAGARLTNNDVSAIKTQVTDLKRVVPQVTGNLNVVAGTGSKAYTIVGTTPENFPMRNINLTQGATFTNIDNDTRARSAVLGYQVALDLFPDQPALGQTVLINNVPFRVVGVTEKKGSAVPGTSSDDTVYVPITVAQEKLLADRAGGLTSVSSITAEASNSEVTARATQQIADVLRKEHNLLFGQDDDFRVLDQASLLNTMNTIITILRLFLTAIGAISLIVGGIGIMNIMLVSVTERTREIGVRKAIGADPGSIRLQFLVESLVVTVVAGAIGVLGAYGLVALISAVQNTFTPEVQMSAVIIAFSVSMAIGVTFGLYPAIRASRLQPVEALRYE